MSTSGIPVLRPGFRSPVTVELLFTWHCRFFPLSQCAAFWRNFLYIEKNAILGAISLLCTWKIIFANIFLVNTLCPEFPIEYTDLHIKRVLIMHLSSESVQWFGRESRTKPFLHLSFIYIEILLLPRPFLNLETSNFDTK